MYRRIFPHRDYDHMGEAIKLVNNFKVGIVILNYGEFYDLEKALIKLLKRISVKELNIDKNKLYF